MVKCNDCGERAAPDAGGYCPACGAALPVPDVHYYEKEEKPVVRAGAVHTTIAKDDDAAPLSGPEHCNEIVVAIFRAAPAREMISSKDILNHADIKAAVASGSFKKTVVLSELKKLEGGGVLESMGMGKYILRT